MDTKNKLVVGDELYDVPGLEVLGLYSGMAGRLAGPVRKAMATEVIVHESVTRSATDTYRILKRRKLGVHFVIDIEGEVIQHADPVIDAVPHAGSTHNPVSIGIEIVNPYYPRYKTSDWPLVIDAKWAHEKKYVVATLHQVEALYRLLLFLTDKNQDLGLDIPLIFHGFDSKKNEFCMNRISWAKFMRKPGIYAHTAFAHADGAFPMLYCIIRTQTGLSPDVSYKRALILATMASSTTARLGD